MRLGGEGIACRLEVGLRVIFVLFFLICRALV